VYAILHIGLIRTALEHAVLIILHSAFEVTLSDLPLTSLAATSSDQELAGSSHKPASE
jgi:hypothetical protein